MNQNFIQKIRSFNRFYTRTIGLITKKFLDSDYSLVQARILFELNKTPGICAKDLVNRTGLDSTYLSKIIKKFEKDCLLTKKSSSKDSRKQKLSLTQEGQNVYSSLQKISNKQISFLIQNLSKEQKRILVNSMETIEKILTCMDKKSNFYSIRSHRPGDIGFVLHRHGVLYAQEYGFNVEFDGYVAKGLAKFVENYNPGKDHMWIAEISGTIIGSVAIVQWEEEIAQLRWLVVEPTERGNGVGKKLLNEAVLFAKQNGYKKIILWTIDFLNAARKLYSNAGFELIEIKESKVWGKAIVEERWELLVSSYEASCF